MGRKVAYECGVCGQPFFENERFQWMHHVPRCYEENREDMENLRAHIRKWNEEPDPEWGDYNRALQAKGIDPMTQYERRSKKSPKRSLLES